MGIKGLTKLLQEKADECMSERDIKSYFGRIIAIDASMCLYQFLIAVRSNSVQGQLTNDLGDVTSHIVGFFYRTIRMLENGIKPVYVFDGKPPSFKSAELKKRKEKRDKAMEDLKNAEMADDDEKQKQMQKRLVKVSKKEVDDVKNLLELMGIPYINAPGEAEAQCAYMVKNNIVYGTGTEDMDALTFGTNKLLRHLTFSQAKKVPIMEFNLNKVLDGLGFNMGQFIDLCILCGCDYTNSIRGIGPKKAYDGIKKYGTIEKFIKTLDKKKYIVNDDFKFIEARELFINPDVNKNIDELKNILKWKSPNENKLIEFLVNNNNLSKERVLNGIKRINASKKKSSQKRLDSFFKLKPNVKSTKKTKKTESKISGKKRKNIKKNEPKSKKRKLN